MIYFTYSLIYALATMTVFVILVINNHKIKMPAKWYAVTLAFFWPIALGVVLYQMAIFIFQVIGIYYNLWSTMFEKNWNNMK